MVVAFLDDLSDHFHTVLVASGDPYDIGRMFSVPGLPEIDGVAEFQLVAAPLSGVFDQHDHEDADLGDLFSEILLHLLGVTDQRADIEPVIKIHTLELPSVRSRKPRRFSGYMYENIYNPEVQRHYIIEKTMVQRKRFLLTKGPDSSNIPLCA